MKIVDIILITLLVVDVGADIALHANQKGLMQAIETVTQDTSSAPEPEPMNAQASADAIAYCRAHDQHHTEIKRKSDGAITSIQCAGPQLECGN